MKISNDGIEIIIIEFDGIHFLQSFLYLNALVEALSVYEKFNFVMAISWYGLMKLFISYFSNKLSVYARDILSFSEKDNSDFIGSVA